MSTDSAAAGLARALRIYEKSASRPRKAQCWAYVACELWNARQDALKVGALKRGTDEYELVSSRYRDASNRLASCRGAEARGHADVRL